MTIDFWRKLNYAFGILTIGVLFGLIAFAANVEIKDLDLWLHLKMGRFILLNGYVPNVDVLSATIAGQPWNNHEWLFQVIVYLVHFQGGFDALTVMQVIVVSISMLILLFLGYHRERQFLTVFALLIVFLNYIPRFTIRPDIFSLMFFAIFMVILSHHMNKRWSVIVLFVLQVLWTNMHGFFFFGPLFLCIGLFSEACKRHVKLPYQWNKVGRLTDEEYGRLKIATIFVILATIVNPETFKGAFYPIAILFDVGGESKVFFEHVFELQKPITWATLFETSKYPYYKAMILLSFFSFVFNRRNIDVSVLFFWIVFLIFSLVAIRNMIFFAFAAYLVFMVNCVSIRFKDIFPFSFSQEKFQRATMIILKIMLAFWMLRFGSILALRGYYDFDAYHRKSEYGGIAQRSYPNKAVDFLVTNGVEGNFFNDFNSGAYMIGRAFPKVKVFIDGRTEVYGADYFRNYLKIWKDGDPDVFAEAEEKHNLTGALLNFVNQRVPAKALRMFDEREDWKPVYFDYDAMIFLKDVPQNKAIIEEFEIDFEQYEAQSLDLQRFGTARARPYRNYERAEALEALGFDRAALAETNSALLADPSYSDIYRLRGKIHGRNGDYRKAFNNFRIAASIDSSIENIKNLAFAYEKLEDYDNAIKFYYKLVHRMPNNASGFLLMTRASVKKQAFENAQKYLDRALAIDNTRIRDILEIGDIAFDQDSFEQALIIYQKALAANKDTDKVKSKIEKTRQALEIK